MRINKKIKTKELNKLILDIHNKSIFPSDEDNTILYRFRNNSFTCIQGATDDEEGHLKEEFKKGEVIEFEKPLHFDYLKEGEERDLDLYELKIKADLLDQLNFELSMNK